MDENQKARNRKVAEKIIKGLKSRHMEGFFAEDREEALKIALDLIPEGSSVSWGGTMSAKEIGLTQTLAEGNYNYIDRNGAGTKEEKRKKEIEAYGCDYYIASSNAITEDGILVNLDGNANRVSCIAYGPEHVIMIVGMNKVTPDLDAAISRTRHEAAPINAQRFDIDTPCNLTGACGDCKSPDSICCHLLITRLERHLDRIKVILVNDNLGY